MRATTRDMSTTERAVVTMESEDEAAALAAELRRRTAERDELAAECMALANRLKQTPEVRAIVGELRNIAACLNDRMSHTRRNNGRTRLNDLLRRLDESPQ